MGAIFQNKDLRSALIAAVGVTMAYLGEKLITGDLGEWKLLLAGAATVFANAVWQRIKPQGE